MLEYADGTIIMQEVVVIDALPCFMFCRGDFVQIDTWVSSSGENGMLR